MKKYTISTVVAVLSLIAAFVALALSAGVEFLFQTEANFNEILIHHLVEAVVLGLFIWAVLSVSLNRILAAPLREIFVSLYAIGKGDETPITVSTRIEELSKIVDGINVMLRVQEGNKRREHQKRELRRSIEAGS